MLTAFLTMLFSLVPGSEQCWVLKNGVNMGFDLASYLFFRYNYPSYPQLKMASNKMDT